MPLKQQKVDQLLVDNTDGSTTLARSRFRSNRLVDWDLEAAIEASLKDGNKPDQDLEAAIKASLEDIGNESYSHGAINVPGDDSRRPANDDGKTITDTGIYDENGGSVNGRIDIVDTYYGHAFDGVGGRHRWDDMDNASVFKKVREEATDIDDGGSLHEAHEQDQVMESDKDDNTVVAEIVHEILQCVDGRTTEDNVESILTSLIAEADSAEAVERKQNGSSTGDEETLLGAVAEQLVFSSHFQNITADNQVFITTHNTKNPKVRLMLPFLSLLLTIEYRYRRNFGWIIVHGSSSFLSDRLS